MTDLTQLGRYEIVRRLGAGGMGVVYLARDPAMRREVALKTIQVQVGMEASEASQRFLRESRAAGSLRHANIVAVHDMGQEDDQLYIVMEYVHGISLMKLMETRELSVREILSMLEQLAGALDYAHRQKVIHRDVKPENVLVEPEGRVKLTDFGLAKLDGTILTQAGTTLGTPAYMAPEQIKGQPATGQSDQFSLAVVAYRMLAGELPFEAESSSAVLYRIVNEPPKMPPEALEGLPTGIASTIQRALEKSPDDRWPSCTVFVDHLWNALEVHGSDQDQAATMMYDPSEEGTILEMAAERGDLSDDDLGTVLEQGDEVSGETPAQPPPDSAAQAEDTALDNGDIIRLVQAGVGEDIILARMKACGGRYDLGVDALIELRRADVPDSIVRAMVLHATQSG